MAERFGCTVMPYGRVFNFADMNNVGAAEARHDTLLFLNDDVTAQRAGWLEPLLGLGEPAGDCDCRGEACVSFRRDSACRHRFRVSGKARGISGAVSSRAIFGDG